MNNEWYKTRRRRILVDMHIPDWDERFLSKYDPGLMADHYHQANVNAVMFYCQSHVGLCYWPTKTGKMHASLKGRDVVGEMVRELKSRDMAACGYYSVIYNNWAFLEHPEWRIVSAGETSDGSFAGHRYGHCCPNNPEYRSFVKSQIEELTTNYSLYGLFYDMTFWPAICLCDHCKAKFKMETGKSIPSAIDWIDPDWCQFQAARERWMTDFASELSDYAISQRPGMSVYHNFATAMFNWTLGLDFKSARHHTFLGADFYGDALEQLMVSKLMLNLTENKPLEFMTSCCVNLRDHVRLKNFELMKTQALASALFSSAFLFIDAVNIDGTVNPATYERIGNVYQTTAPYELYTGGEAVEDIALYFSSESKMDFVENGKMLSEASLWDNDFPHVRSLRGFCRIFQQNHLPFGIITRKQLTKLNRYKIVILPNVLRMDEEEVSAIRDYVRQGGKLYASRYTSLTSTAGRKCEDFMLAEVFGCHFAQDDLGVVNYLKPVSKSLEDCLYPQAYLSHFPLQAGGKTYSRSQIGTLRLAESVQGRVLGTLTVPYANPHLGMVFDQNWASIHCSPPWQDTLIPMIVENQYGKGRAIYSASDFESVDSEANDRLLLGLIQSLLDAPLTYTAQAHPAVWMNVCHQPELKRFNLGFLNYPSAFPAIPVPVINVTIIPPAGKQFVQLLERPSGTSIAFTLEESGALSAKIHNLESFTLLEAQYR